MSRRESAHAARVAAWSVASALLRYPDESLAAALPAIRETALAEKIPHAGDVAALIDAWRGRDLIALETEYVELFDLGRSTSLYLTWHQYGDRRQRGLVLSKLKREYMSHGMSPLESELPDWLPLMLEFAANVPDPAGVDLLEKWRAAIELIRKMLHDQDRPQAVLLDVVSATLPKLGGNVRATVERLLAEGPPDEEVGLEPFGPGNEMPGAFANTELSALTGGPNE
jgi:nitrate reductase delta subunit